ncbi:uncharacterized protein UDID_05327 [Ustilago sp. UG-2017a]|nr:uncharacterized protein UDID_05327 [Ustilago sp. UG-2017a]
MSTSESNPRREGSSSSSSCFHTAAPNNLQTEEAFDSSAGSSSESRNSPPLTRKRATRTTKRVLSEGDIISLPSPKRNCNAITCALRIRSTAISSSISDWNAQASNTPSSPIAAWRKARQLRQRGRRTPLPTATRIQTEQRVDILPELRLLSATRTAPIGSLSLTNPAADAFRAKSIQVDMYDEKSIVGTPERQRFWPIVDQQLDYTAARMLQFSSGSPCQLCHVWSDSTLVRVGSSGSDASPFIPDPLGRLHASAIAGGRGLASAYAKKRTETEAQRTARVPLSARDTLGAMIDFTRGQAAQSRQYGQSSRSPASSQLIQQAESVR